MSRTWCQVDLATAHGLLKKQNQNFRWLTQIMLFFSVIFSISFTCYILCFATPAATAGSVLRSRWTAQPFMVAM
jgi:uncharacterized membrane protein (DUF485 family)